MAFDALVASALKIDEAQLGALLGGGPGRPRSGPGETLAIEHKGLRAVFHLPMQDACKQLDDMKPAAFKRLIQGLGIARWPAGTLASLSEQFEAATDGETRRGIAEQVYATYASPDKVAADECRPENALRPEDAEKVKRVVAAKRKREDEEGETAADGDGKEDREAVRESPPPPPRPMPGRSPFLSAAAVREAASHALPPAGETVLPARPPAANEPNEPNELDVGAEIYDLYESSLLRDSSSSSMMDCNSNM
jgi:RWP-RK domain